MNLARRSEFMTWGQLIAEHSVRLFDKGKKPLNPEHEETNNAYTKKKEGYRAAKIRRFIETFPQIGELYIEGHKTDVTANMYWHMEEIIENTAPRM